MTSLPVIKDNPLCHDCGACCMEVGSAPPYAPYEVQHLPSHLKADVTKMITQAMMKGAGRGTCPFLSPDKRCLHYDHRPIACITYVPDSDYCKKQRKSMGVD